MQLLSPASSTGAPVDRAAGTVACAAAVLEGLPPVMWFIRCQMRKQRTGELSVPQFRALVLLDRHPTASLSLVAEHLGSSQPSASRLIDGLVTRDFVARGQSQRDRRQVMLMLTVRGKAVLETARAATREYVARELGRLSEADRQTVTSAMRILQGVFAPRGCENRAAGEDGAARAPGKSSAVRAAAVSAGRRSRKRAASVAARGK
jgi:DNA-binding MarR family transcriptional regulator